jgi:hypothetical protein
VLVLTNAGSGYSLAEVVKRLLNILYDGKPEAAENLASVAKHSDEALAKLRSDLSITTPPAQIRPNPGRSRYP